MRNISITTISLLIFTASRGLAVCGGDCSADGEVTIDELVLGVNIALGTDSSASCRAMDSNNDSEVTIDELVAAVSNALSGCPSLVGSYSGSVQLDGSQHGELTLAATVSGQISGTLTIRAGLSRFLPALTLPTAALALSGTYNVANGTFTVTGQFLDTQGASHTIDIGGALPGSSNTSPFTLQVDGQTYIGNLSRDSSVAPTPTATATPTQGSIAPTPPARPPVPAGCTKSGGYTRVVFSEASGTNSLVSFGQPLDLFKVTGTIVAITRGIGGASVTCPTTLTAPIVTLEFNVGGFPQDLAVGNTYPLHNGPVIELPLIKIAQVDYAEVLATDPFNRHAWRSESGSLTIDSIDGDTVTLHIDALMVAPLPPATGTFRMQVYTIVDKVLRP